MTERAMEEMAAAYLARDVWLRANHARSLPPGDAMVDRWERAKRLGFSEGASIYGSSVVFGDVAVGRHTWIGPNTLLDASSATLSIGEYCSISAGVQIYTHDTVLWAISGGELGKREGPVSIGNNVYIGSLSVIVANVSIGNRCVVAAHSLVNRNVADGTIVGGVPARRLGIVEGEGAEARMCFDRKNGDSDA